MIRVEQARPAGRQVEFDAATADLADGCGQPPPGVRSGRVCAGVGTVLSCQLCPHSPTYWRDRSPRAVALRRALVGADQVSAPQSQSQVINDRDDDDGHLL